MLINILIQIYIFSVFIMLAAFFLELKLENASYVDVFWSFGIGISSIYIYWFFSENNLRNLIILSCAILWSFRLTFHLFKRIYFSKEEDTRYKTMRNYLGDKKNLGFFVFFQLQAFFIVLFTTPIAIALLSKKSDFDYLDFFGVGIFIFSFIGEYIADMQLSNFKKENPNKISVCKRGLWNYSRHPNYFFEWLHWFCYAFFSFNSPLFIVNLIMPFLMMVFLLKLTGIPHVEREALKNKPGYKLYMEETSMFIPWFK